MTTASPQRVLWLVAGALLALVFTVTAGIHLAGWTIGTVTRSEHHVLPGSVRSVRIDGSAGDVTLVPSSGREVVVDSRAKGSLWLPKLRTRIEGDRINVSGDCHVVVFGHCSASFVIHVPAGMPVSVDTGSGDVRASGLSGPVDFSVSSGDLLLRSLTGGTTAQVKSGDIDASGLAGRVSLKSWSGDITAADLTARAVTAHAISGDVLVDAAVAPQRVTASATSGDVMITVPRGQAYDAQVDTASGDRHIGVTNDSSSDRGLSATTISGDASIRYR